MDAHARRRALATLACILAVAILVAGPAQAQPDRITPKEREAIAQSAYLITILSLGGVWWTYRHHMKRDADAPLEDAEAFCPACGEAAKGAYCARCGDPLGEGAS